MATPRNSAPVNFGGVNQPTTQSAQIGAAPVDVNQFSRPTATRGGEQESALLDGLLGVITPAVNHLAKVDMQVQQEEAYLRGSAAAGTGRAQSEVESNILTKDWATAGYQDTRGRLSAADAEAQTAVDMKRLREQSPEKFAEYLAEKRDKLMAGFSGMSREARKGMLAQQLVSDRAAIQKHAIEHTAFQIDQKKEATAAQIKVAFAALGDSKVDATTYGLASANAFTAVYSGIWQNPSLPKEVRQNMTSEAMQYALASNHQQLFQMFKNQKVTLPDGSSGTVFSQLPFDEQTKLVKAYDKSLDDTKQIRASEFHKQLGFMSAEIDNPSLPLRPWSEVEALLTQGVKSGYITADREGAVAKQWGEAAYKNQNSGQLSSAYSSRNGAVLHALGKTDAEAHAAWRQTQVRMGVSAPAVIAMEFELGLSGSPAAFKSIGNSIGAAVDLIGVVEGGDKTQAASLDVLLKGFEGLGHAKRPGALALAYSSLTDKQVEKLEQYNAAIARGEPPKMAAESAVAAILKNAAEAPQVKAARASGHYKEDQEILARMAPQGPADAVWGWLGFGNVDSLRWKLRQGKGVLPTDANETQGLQQVAQRNQAIQEELTYQSKHGDPSLGASAREKAALAAVVRRAVPVGDTMLIIPKLAPGETMSSFFGAPDNSTPESIGLALSQQIKLRDPAGHLAFESLPGGRIKVTQYGADGSRTFDELNPKDIGAKVDEIDRERSGRMQGLLGVGITKRVGNGTVTYNGNSTVNGLRPEWMAQFRESLITHEGFTSEPIDIKSDSGKSLKVVGAGIASSNDFYPKPGPDGKIGKAQLDLAFAQASNAAAQYGAVAASKAGLSNSQPAFELLSGMAYQANNISAQKQYAPVLEALRNRDATAAKAAIQKTAVWRDAQGKDKDGNVRGGVSRRNAYYLNLIDKALEK